MIAAAIASSDVWKAARTLYGRTNAELEALIAQQREDALPAERVVVEAARYIHNLRHALATGDA